MAATARVIWLCACVRYWPYRALVFECVTCFNLLLFSNKPFLVSFGLKKVRYLGNVISKDEIRPGPKSVPFRYSVKEVRAFLG